MIRFALVCDHGHEFDAWFASGETRAVICPSCGSRVVRKAPMAPAVTRRRAGASHDRGLSERKKTSAFLKGLRAHLEANAENVGPPRKMHCGEVETRSIYGEASLEKARSLQEEGIPAMPLPVLPEDHN